MRQQHSILTEALAASNREMGALQQQLVRVKSLAGLGDMAAGAAHEMNNPLAVVCGRAQLLASKLTDEKLKQDAQLIAQQGERLSQIITDMMAFAKPAAPKLAACAMGELAREAMEAARGRMQGAPEHGEIPLMLEAAENLPVVHVDVAQIRAAITEVIVNAIQASTSEAARQTGVHVQVGYDVLDGARDRASDGSWDRHERGNAVRQALRAQHFILQKRPAGNGVWDCQSALAVDGTAWRNDSLGSAARKLGTTVVMILPGGECGGGELSGQYFATAMNF